MLKCFILFFFLMFLSNGNAQENDKKQNAYGFWLLPSQKDNIYGVAIGLIGSEAICDKPNVKNTHGINIQMIGQGLFLPLNRKIFSFKNMFSTDTSFMVMNKDSVNYKAVNNGLLISGFGTLTDVSNGVVFSGWFSMGQKMNGLGFNLWANKYTISNGLFISMSNESYSTKGIQVGLINRTKKLKGFQFGLWNVNEKRKFPLINWCFFD